MKQLVIAATAAALLSACSQQAVDECLQATNPVECAAVREAGGDVNDYLLYGMVGYMIGSSMNGGHRTTYIMQDPNYRGARRYVGSYNTSYKRVMTPGYKPYSQRVKTVTSTTTTKKSMLGGTKTTTKTTTSTSSYRSSGSSSSYRSSGSSFGGGRRR